MVAILERHLPASCTVHPSKRLVNYTEPEQESADSTSHIRLEFADGTTATTDVFIGADGVRSAVRKTMFEAASKDNGDDKADLTQYIDATFTGLSIYRSLVPAETLRRENPENISLKEVMSYAGKGRVDMFGFSLIFRFTYPWFVVPCHLSDFQRHYNQHFSNRK
jgi:salicylate hydroxylase